jgi:hypothetical protein
VWGRLWIVEDLDDSGDIREFEFFEILRSLGGLGGLGEEEWGREEGKRKLKKGQGWVGGGEKAGKWGRGRMDYMVNITRDMRMDYMVSITRDMREDYIEY